MTCMQHMSAASRAQTKARKESSEWRPISHLRTAGQSQHEAGVIVFFFFCCFASEIDRETLWNHTYNGAALEGAGGYKRKDFPNYLIIRSCEASHLPWICATAGRSAVVPHRGSRGGRGMGFSLYALNIPLIQYAITLWWYVKTLMDGT